MATNYGYETKVTVLTYLLLNLLFFQCRLIVSTMANQRCQAVNAMFYPLFIWVLIVPFVRSTELEVGILIFYTAAVAVCHIHYGIFLVSKTHTELALRKLIFKGYSYPLYNPS